MIDNNQPRYELICFYQSFHVCISVEELSIRGAKGTHTHTG